MAVLQKIILAVVFYAGSLCLVTCNSSTDKKEQGLSFRNELVRDTARIKGYIDKAYYLVPKEPDSADLYYRLAYSESLKINYHDGIVIAILGITNRQFEEGRYDSCEYYYDIAETHATTPDFEKRMYPSLMLNKGTYYYLKGDKVNADRTYLLGLEKARTLGLEKSDIATMLLYNLSFTKVDLKQPEEALEFLDAAYEISTSKRDSNFPGVINLTKADILLDQGRIDSAGTILKQLAPPGVDLPLETIKVLSKFYFKTHEPFKAIPYIKQGIRDAVQSRILFEYEAMQVLLGTAYFRMGRVQEAKEILERSLDSSIAKGFHESIPNNYPVLIDVQKKLGNYKKALQLQQAFNIYNDSILNKEKANTINELNIRFRSEQKDLLLAENKLLLEKQRNDLLKQRIQTYFIAGAALLLVAAIIILRVLATRKNKLKEQEILVLRQESEIIALRSQMEGEEKERARISMELHDGIGSQLSSALVQFRTLKKNSPELQSSELYKGIEGLLDLTASDIRKTANNLMPDILTRLGLPEAVSEYIHSININPNLQINLQVYGNFGNIPLPLQLFLYRIVQELVHNIVKHANATEALVQVINNDDLVSVTVEDNGKGFDTSTISGGSGLNNVRKRVEQIGGTLSMRSTLNSTTTIYVELDTKSFINE